MGKNILPPRCHQASKKNQQVWCLVWGRDRLLNTLKATSKLLKARAHKARLDLSSAMDALGVMLSNNDDERSMYFQ